MTGVHLRRERALLREGARIVAGMDEVGRGALAGPVSVGVVAVDLATRSCPPGVTDSKLLTAAARTALLPALHRWGVARAIGHASAAEIDEIGIIAALRLAGTRALLTLGVEVDVVLLDGSHDWLTPPAQQDLFESAGLGPLASAEVPELVPPARPADAWLQNPWPEGPGSGPVEPVGAAVLARRPEVRTLVKADRTCASVAAASVLAKCARDAIMVELAPEHPQYGWAENKGYGSADHIDALAAHGPSPWHRRSWRLPGVTSGGAATPVLVDGA